MNPDERLLGGYTGRMLAVTALAWAALQLARFAVPPLLPEIRGDLSLSLAQAGVALTVLQGVYALFQYPSGRLSDSWSRATLLVPSLVVLAAACLLVGSATSYLLFVLGVGVFGFGKGLYAIPSQALLSDLFVERRGRALGVFSAGTDLGGVLASGAAVAAIALATWRVVFLPVAVVLAVLAALFVRWNREPYVVEGADLAALTTARRLLATSRQRWSIVAFVCFYFMVNGVLNFLPEYLREAKAFSPGLAGGAYALLFAFGLAVKPASGAVSDRFPRHSVAVAGMALAALALGLLVVAGSVLAVAAAVGLFAVGYKAQFPVIDAILLDAAPDANAGGDLGPPGRCSWASAASAPRSSATRPTASTSPSRSRRWQGFSSSPRASCCGSAGGDRQRNRRCVDNDGVERRIGRKYVAPRPDRENIPVFRPCGIRTSIRISSQWTYFRTLIRVRPLRPLAMAQGNVDFFNDTGGYGFISTDDADEDVFFHMEDVGGPDLEEGQDIEFDIEDAPKGPRASNVTRL